LFLVIVPVLLLAGVGIENIERKTEPEKDWILAAVAR
jgi:hypothetical protein